jgi:hypothetical protein
MIVVSKPMLRVDQAVQSFGPLVEIVKLPLEERTQLLIQGSRLCDVIEYVGFVITLDNLEWVEESLRIASRYLRHLLLDD